MDVRNEILKEREERHTFVKSHVTDYQVIVLRANIPGANKQIKEAYLIINYFDKIISQYKPIKVFDFDGYDGPTKIYLFPRAVLMKNVMVLLEEESFLGRLVDIDVHLNSINSENRSKPRHCFICDDLAFNCSRSQKHSLDELMDFVEQKCHSFLETEFTKLIDKSIMTELDLTNKFGLVTPDSMGSHTDMDYSLMCQAKTAIEPYLLSLFFVGFEGEKGNFSSMMKQAREIGIEAEKAMFQATDNVNAYKGLIFNFGLLLVSTGYALAYNQTIDDIFANVRLLLSEEKEKTNVKSMQTNCAIQEAMAGYPHVQDIFYRYDFSKEEQVRKALMELIATIDDSVFQKRCQNPEKVEQIKNRFKKEMKKMGNIERLTSFCIKNKLSFGGSADLLILSVFMNQIGHLFF